MAYKMISQLAWPGSARSRLEITVIAVIGGLLAGVIVSVVNPVTAMMSLAGVGAVALGIYSWRASFVGLLIFLPFAGAFSVFAADGGAVVLLAKDIFFVIPAYLGFAVSRLTARQPMDFRRSPLLFVTGLAIIAFAELGNPALISLPVGFVGVRQWVFYTPLLWLSYHFFRDSNRIVPGLRVMAVVMEVAVVIGLLQAILLFSGHSDLVYAVYGDKASAVTQGFTKSALGRGQFLPRVPGTFSFAAQYFSFTAAAVAVLYATWATDLSRSGRRRKTWAVGLSSAILASLTAGSKGGILTVAILVAMILMFEGNLSFPALGSVTAIMIVVLGTLNSIVGVSVDAMLTLSLDITKSYAQVILDGLNTAVTQFPYGLGPGMDSFQARHAVADPTVFLRTVLVEGWFARASIELGWLGLAVALALMGRISILTLRALTEIDGTHRPMAACCAAFIVWNIGYLVKGAFIDVDPANCYFWIVLGVLFWAADNFHSDSRQPEFALIS